MEVSLEPGIAFGGALDPVDCALSRGTEGRYRKREYHPMVVVSF